MLMEISSDIKLDFSDVRLVPTFGDIDSRRLINLIREYVTPISNKKLEGIGIIAANMDGVGTFAVCDALAQNACFTALIKSYSEEELINYFNSNKIGVPYAFYTLGSSESDFQKLLNVSKKAPIDKICYDQANGYLNSFYDNILKLRTNFPDAIIMAGNVVTPEAVLRAYENGLDIMKIGISQGSVCLTSHATGIGYPQLSCILDIKQAIKECKILLCSDGGCKTSGDMSIAFSAGADFVMSGGMLAGTTEGGGDLIDGKIQFYGMSSKTANEKHFGGLQDYRSSEGRTVLIPHKGKMDDVIKNILGGIRSTCTYFGAKNTAELSIKAKAIRVNSSINRSFENHTIGN